MNVYTCTDHDYHWPVGVASVAVADSEDEARGLLDAALQQSGLRPSGVKPYTLQRLSLDAASAIVLLDGNY